MGIKPNMRILFVAPPWVSIPPTSYGGTETVVDTLGRELVRLGHDVALFATGDSTIDVRRAWLFDRALGFDGFAAGHELAQVLASREFADRWEPDVIHDHTLTGAVFEACAPLVVTNHGEFNVSTNQIFSSTPVGTALVAISESQKRCAPSDVKVAAVIHHGIDVSAFPLGCGDGGYLAFLGRMTPDKGVDIAMSIARKLNLPLRIAAKMREPNELSYFKERIQPMLGGGIEYVGELSGQDKMSFLAQAKVLINPIQWPEPFGMVMVEALACGTPVVATSRGAAPEIVQDGVVGAIADDLDQLCEATLLAAQLNRSECREFVAHHFSASRMAQQHETLYAAMLR